MLRGEASSLHVEPQHATYNPPFPNPDEPIQAPKENDHETLAYLCTLLIYCIPLQSDAESASPKPNQTLPQEPYWQLFLDDYIIERSTGFRRVLHHPQPRGVVLKPDKPWETFGVVPQYVGRRKDGSLECYYIAIGGMGVVVCYATSEDGIHWEKPNLGLVDSPWGKENNMVPIGIPRDLGSHGNVRDPAMRFVFPSQPYKRRSKILFSSETPDFLNDPNWREKLVDSGGIAPHPGSTLQYWDDIHQEWVAVGQAPNHPPVRCVGRKESADLKNWTLEHYL